MTDHIPTDSHNYRWRKRPVVIEAFCLGIDPMPDWFCDARTRNEVTTHAGLTYRDLDHALIHTKEGVMRAERGDYVIKGVHGEIYPCKPDIFEATYDPA